MTGVTSTNEPPYKPIDLTVTFVTVVTCEMNILMTSEAQVWHWVVGQTPAMQGLRGASLTLTRFTEERSPRF
jgi:hypothetical protein